jgi:hypothetical protein
MALTVTMDAIGEKARGMIPLGAVLVVLVVLVVVVVCVVIVGRERQ